VNLATSAESILYTFTGRNHGKYGTHPEALLNVGGELYGTTSAGGCGGVYGINPGTGKFALLHRFAEGTDGCRSTAALINLGGALFGTTSAGGGLGGGLGAGTVFNVNPSTGAEAVVYSFAANPDGSGPGAALLNVDGTLYGTTYAGGTTGNGTVFSIAPETGVQ
jgi:uncharacterized repeat protein (TIGR03803 family)